MKTLPGTMLVALTLPIYLFWARNQAEHQLDRMQADAFNTPGVQGPITGPVALAGFALLVGYALWWRLMGLRATHAVFSLITGVAAGIGLFRWYSEPNE